MKEKHTCREEVFRDYRFRVCGKTAKYERDGKWYCGTHDPVAKQARDDKFSAKIAAELAASTAAHKERQLATAALEWMREHMPGALEVLSAKLR